jgi:hypothetical protein
MANFNGLTFAVVPAVTGAGALNTAGLPAATVIAGVLDPTNGVHKIFNPQTLGLPVASGDAYTKWLPTLSVAPTAATVNDQYWTPTFTGTQTGATVVNPNNKFGQITLNITPATADTVNASSVQTIKVSPNALVITCTAGTF